MPAIESLTTRLPVELRATGGLSRTIGGYAAVFGSRSESLGPFVEQIDNVFFNKSRGDGWPGVVCRFSHRDEYILGATRSGTLRLDVDATGLLYDVDLPQCRSDVLELVTRGDVSNSSIAFEVFQDDWSFGDGQPLRTLVSGRLIDVAPVAVPAYRSTTVALRSLARFVGVTVEDVVNYAARDELRKLFVRTDSGELSGAAARAQIMRKRYGPEPPREPTPGVVALNRTLAKKHPQHPPQ